MTFKHIVIGGGGPGGFLTYGVIKESHKKNLWNHKDIVSIHSTSVGTLLSLLILMELEWDWADDFLVKRPWSDVIPYPSNLDYLRFLKEKGFYNSDLINKIILPLLKLFDLNENSTLKDLYNKCPKDFYCYASFFSDNSSIINVESFSHKSHPDLLITHAIFMSCSIPLLAKPMYYNSFLYADGAFVANIPIDECIKNTNCEINEILAFHFNRGYWSTNSGENISPDMTTLNYFQEIFSHFGQKLIMNNELSQNPNVCRLIGYSEGANFWSAAYWKSIVESSKVREKLIKDGEKSFLEYYEKNKNQLILLKYGIINNKKKLIRRNSF